LYSFTKKNKCGCDLLHFLVIIHKNLKDLIF
jgi:hypothetical protein